MYSSGILYLPGPKQFPPPFENYLAVDRLFAEPGHWGLVRLEGAREAWGGFLDAPRAVDGVFSGGGSREMGGGE